MSRKGCCYDNAAMESFFHIVELVHREVYSEYNRQRRHSAIGNQTMQYELKMSAYFENGGRS